MLPIALPPRLTWPVNGHRPGEERRKYLELAERWLVLELGALEQDADDESRMFVGQDGPGRLDEQVSEGFERVESQTLQLGRHQAPDTVVEVRYTILYTRPPVQSVPVARRPCPAAGKVTVGPASHRLYVTDFSGLSNDGIKA